MVFVLCTFACIDVSVWLGFGEVWWPSLDFCDALWPTSAARLVYNATQLIVTYYKKEEVFSIMCLSLLDVVAPLPLNFQRVVTLVAAEFDGERPRALVVAKRNLRRSRRRRRLYSRVITVALTKHRSNDSFRPRRGVAHELAESVH